MNDLLSERKELLIYFILFFIKHPLMLCDRYPKDYGEMDDLREKHNGVKLQYTVDCFISNALNFVLRLNRGHCYCSRGYHIHEYFQELRPLSVSFNPNENPEQHNRQNDFNHLICS